MIVNGVNFVSMMEMNLTYKYSLLAKQCDHVKLTELLESQRVLYNAALQERRDAWKMGKKSVSLYDQYASLTECRKEFNDMKNIPANLQRGTLKRVDRAFQGFFRRVKRGQSPGYPRFKGNGWFDTLEWSEYSGIRFNGSRIKSKAFGSIRVNSHRQLPKDSKIKSVKITRDCKGWYVCFSVQIESPRKQLMLNLVGMDVGLESLATLSTGEKIPNIRLTKEFEKRLRIKQRKLSRCKKGSNGRKKSCKELQRVYNKLKNKRHTYLHQVYSRLVKEFDCIVVEDLNVQGMAKSRFSKSINDVAWSTLFSMIEYKAEKAGTHFIRVNPKYTSQDCSSCGERIPKKLLDRLHVCMSCGLVMDRDENAAKNILNKAVLSLVSHKVSDNTKLVTGNIIERGS